jgi:hypothetical protein
LLASARAPLGCAPLALSMSARILDSNGTMPSGNVCATASDTNKETNAQRHMLEMKSRLGNASLIDAN